MEIKLQVITDAQDVDNINKIELMGLYSVSDQICKFNNVVLQSAIEYYHRQADEDRLNYYIDKNSRLNDAIRQTFERTERQKERQ